MLATQARRKASPERAALSTVRLDNAHFWRIGQDTAAINVIDAEGDVFTLVTLNDTCHLNQMVLPKEKKT